MKLYIAVYLPILISLMQAEVELRGSFLSRAGIINPPAANIFFMPEKKPYFDYCLFLHPQISLGIKEIMKVFADFDLEVSKEKIYDEFLQNSLSLNQLYGALNLGNIIKLKFGITKYFSGMGIVYNSSDFINEPKMLNDYKNDQPGKLMAISEIYTSFVTASIFSELLKKTAGIKLLFSSIPYVDLELLYYYQRNNNYGGSIRWIPFGFTGSFLNGLALIGEAGYHQKTRYYFNAANKKYYWSYNAGIQFDLVPAGNFLTAEYYHLGDAHSAKTINKVTKKLLDYESDDWIEYTAWYKELKFGFNNYDYLSFTFAQNEFPGFKSKFLNTLGFIINGTVNLNDKSFLAYAEIFSKYLDNTTISITAAAPYGKKYTEFWSIPYLYAISAQVIMNF